MDGLDRKRALYRRQRAQPGVGSFELLHDEAICGVTKPSVAVSFQIGGIKAQRAHARDELFGELAGTMERYDLAHDFLLHKTPRPIASCSFLIREEVLDIVVIQRGHIIESPSHARKFNGRTS